MTTRIRDAKRAARRATHETWGVPALYLATPAADPKLCSVRLWLKTDDNMVGALKGSPSADMVETEDRLRFELSTEIRALRTGAVVSVAAGEAYRIAFGYPADGGYQTARVTRLSVAETATLPVPT